VDRENLPAAIAEGSLARKCPKIKKRRGFLDFRRDAWLAAACDTYFPLRPMPEKKPGEKCGNSLAVNLIAGKHGGTARRRIAAH
jgi:hypothetical protein